MDQLENSTFDRPFKGTKLEEATRYSHARAKNRGSGKIRSAISNTDGCLHYVCPVCGDEYPAYMSAPRCCGRVLTKGDIHEDS